MMRLTPVSPRPQCSCPLAASALPGARIFPLRLSVRATLFGALLLGLLLTLTVTLMAGQAWGAPPQDIVHTWKRIYYGKLDGRESLLFSERFDRAKIALGDMDGDGDLDLFLGRGDGRVMYFQNQGTKTAPKWRLLNDAISGQDRQTRAGEETFHTIDVGANAAPTLVDMDGDGDLDLVIGSAAGNVFYYVNQGNRFLANFRQESENFLGKSLGLNLTVKFPDLNGDGLPDLSVGNEAGDFYIALNQGSRLEPRYCLESKKSQHCLAVLTKLGNLHPADNAVPEWVDWDGDGDLDLMVGKSDGTVAFYRNIGTAQHGNWERAQERFQILDSGGFAAPVFADVNGDGHTDLLLAGDKEEVVLYLNRPKRRLPLWLEDKNALQIRRLGGFQTRIRITAGDLDGDGDQDLIIGTRSGQLIQFINESKGDEVAFRQVPGLLLPTPQRAFSAPTLVDLDGDGDLDLLVGGRDGRLEWLENFGSPRQARWRFRSLFFSNVDVGGISVPLAADLDGDGDPDLLVGNSLGNLIYFENVGTKTKPRMVLRSVRFGGLKTGGYASPALFPWNPKSGPDLVVGSQDGSLLPAVRDPAVQVAAAKAFIPQGPWEGLRAPNFSAPLFVQLVGDPIPDLLVGTGSGALLFWRYAGSRSASQIAAEGRPGRSNIVGGDTLATTEQPSRAGLAEQPQGRMGTSPPDLSRPPPKPERLPLEPVLVYESSTLEKLKLGKSTKPAVFDYNGDGRPDLVVGTRDGRLVLLVNTPSDSKTPGEEITWKPISEHFAGYRGGRNAAPMFGDLDGDGDQDLVVGNERGQVLFYENIGAKGKPLFRLKENALASVRAGKNAVPALIDLNRDGRLDLVVGNLAGEMRLFQQSAQQRLEFSLVVRKFLGVDVGINATPAFGDLTNFDTPYLILGSDKGAVYLFGATKTSLMRSSGWKENRELLGGLRVPPGSRPVLADLDGDGDLDLLVGSDKGPIYFYRNQAQ